MPADLYCRVDRQLYLVHDDLVSDAAVWGSCLFWKAIATDTRREASDRRSTACPRSVDRAIGCEME
jgi:hypothetical protein